MRSKTRFFIVLPVLCLFLGNSYNGSRTKVKILFNPNVFVLFALVNASGVGDIPDQLPPSPTRHQVDAYSGKFSASCGESINRFKKITGGHHTSEMLDYSTLLGSPPKFKIIKNEGGLLTPWSKHTGKKLSGLNDVLETYYTCAQISGLIRDVQKSYRKTIAEGQSFS